MERFCVARRQHRGDADQQVVAVLPTITQPSEKVILIKTGSSWLGSGDPPCVDTLSGGSLKSLQLCAFLRGI
jgi:hypothetical protein